jgi:hypothetical protein
VSDYQVGDKVLYKVRDDLWLPSTVVNITPRRIVIKPHGYDNHRNTVASQLRPIPREQQKG